MQLYPAIDMKDGCCVRLTQGRFDNVKLYSEHPEKVAAYWQEQGATYLHLVDLDGALSGRSVNENVIKKVVKEVSMPVQIGGGIRTKEAVDYLLGLGVSRVIIGTKAVEEPAFMEELVKTYGPDRIVAGVDAKDGMVAIHGWETVSEISAVGLCTQMKAMGVRHIVYTDISKDGMLSGPNVSYTKELTDKTGMDIIASGGVSSMEDLEQLYRAKIQGAIIGKALYENRIQLKTAISRFEPA